MKRLAQAGRNDQALQGREGSHPYVGNDGSGRPDHVPEGLSYFKGDSHDVEAAQESLQRSSGNKRSDRRLKSTARRHDNDPLRVGRPSRGHRIHPRGIGAETQERPSSKDVSGRPGPSLPGVSDGDRRREGAKPLARGSGQSPGDPLKGLDTWEQPRNDKPPDKRGDRYKLDWERADRMIEKMETCGDMFNVMHHTVDRCGAIVVAPQSCDCRACRKCSRRRIGRVLTRYQKAVMSFRHPALVTFTVPNVMTAEELPGALKKLVKGFERLRRRSVWKKCRGFWSLEITWSVMKGFHPHLHCVVDLPWIDLRGLARDWKDLTGGLHEPDVKRPRSPSERAGLAAEGVKYVTKSWELEDAPLRAILAVIGGRRMFNAFGGLKAAVEEDSEPLVCPKCGDVYLHRKYGTEWEMWGAGAAEVRALLEGPRWPDVYRGWACRDGPDIKNPRQGVILAGETLGEDCSLRVPQEIGEPRRYESLVNQ